MIKINGLIGSYVLINGFMFLIALIVGFVDYTTEPSFKLTFRQKVFWTILIPGMSLGYSFPTIIVNLFKWFFIIKFFEWLAEDKQDIVKDDRNKYNNYCLECRSLSYGNYGYKNSERKCKVLDLEFLKYECPCEGKLYEKG